MLTKPNNIVILYVKHIQTVDKETSGMREYLMRLRKQNNFSENDMAKKLHITEQYYQMIESGTRQKKMDITLIVALANTFNVIPKL